MNRCVSAYCGQCDTLLASFVVRDAGEEAEAVFDWLCRNTRWACIPCQVMTNPVFRDEGEYQGKALDNGSPHR